MYKGGGEYREGETFCFPSCRSTEHAEEIISAILRGNEYQALAFMCWRCSNYASVADEAGRTALHIASSSGKLRVLKWLIKKGINLNIQDKESGYTPLHRSLYHGQLNSARYLIMHGADLNIVDNEGLTALDHIVRDKPLSTNNSSNDERNPQIRPYYEAYVWGSNLNFNLGNGDNEPQQIPDKINYFCRNGITIEKVSMGEFHSIFLSEDGQAYSCGLGEGGRLGHNDEENAKTPKKIKIPVNEYSPPSTSTENVVLYASVGVDHSVLMTKGGTIYTFGKNDYFQLGLHPPPNYQLSPKALSLTINLPKGVSAARYHSVAWSLTDLYTWGYNSGQLGYRTEDKYQKTPKRLLNIRGINFLNVASTDNAIVIATMKGEIYLMHAYSCLKIGSSFGIIRHLHLSEDHTDHNIVKSADNRGKEDDRREDYIKVLIVNEAQKLMLWQSSTGQFSRCSLQVGNRSLVVIDAAMSNNKLMVVTNEFEAFESDYIIDESRERGASPANQTLLQKLVENDTSIIFHMKKVRGAHRAMSISCNANGSNYCMLQVNPICFISIPKVEKSAGFEKCLLSLLEEATESDLICDVVFIVAGVHIPAHRYIIESNCIKLASILSSAEESQISRMKAHTSREEDAPKSEDILKVKLENMHPLIFKEVLKYVYVGKFEYCTPSSWSPEKDAQYAKVLQTNEALMQFYSMIYKCEDLDEDSTNEESEEEVNFKLMDYNPVNDACITAAYFELNELVTLLDNMTYDKSSCSVSWKSGHEISGNENHEISFNLQNCQHLYDVFIECGFEGRVISAHKCVLVMRSRYFETILRENRLEVSERRNLFLPFPFEVMEAILFYLYHDKVSFSINSEDVEFICDVLIAADQILLERLKFICEVTLTHLITMKNVSELFRYSDMYKAYHLQSCCLEYMSANLAALLESRALDSTHDELINDLQLYYMKTRPAILLRTLGIPKNYPDLEQLQSVLTNIGVPLEEEHLNKYAHLLKSKREGNQEPKNRKSRNTYKLRKVGVDERAEAITTLSINSIAANDLGTNYETLVHKFSSSTLDEGPLEESSKLTETDEEQVKSQKNTEIKSKEVHSIQDNIGKNLQTVGSRCKERESAKTNKKISPSSGDQPSLTPSDKSSQQRRLIVLDQTTVIPKKNPDFKQLQSTPENEVKPEENYEMNVDNLSKIHSTKEGINAPRKRKLRKKHKLKKVGIDRCMETMAKQSIESTTSCSLENKSEALDSKFSSNTMDTVLLEEFSELIKSDAEEVRSPKDDKINSKDPSRKPGLVNVGAHFKKDLKNENGDLLKLTPLKEGTDVPKKRKSRKRRKPKKVGIDRCMETMAKQSIESAGCSWENMSEALSCTCSSNIVDEIPSEESSKLTDSDVEEVTSQKFTEIKSTDTLSASDSFEDNVSNVSSKYEEKVRDEKFPPLAADLHQICLTSTEKVLQQRCRTFEMETEEKELFCLPSCRSIIHAEEIITAILRGSEDQALAFMCWRCSNYGGVMDESGRTALHIASSCGKLRVLQWLVRRGVDLNFKDKESGYTALHRSLYHGQLNSARYLIKHGADPFILDNEGLNALDHATTDRPTNPAEERKDDQETHPYYEAYLWGRNVNNNLGIEHQPIQHFPCKLDYFWRNKISIKKASLGEFHSIFLSEDGQVFSCGLGEGGRLGHGSEANEKTPRQIMLSPEHALPPFTVPKHTVIAASVGQNHSILITKSGNIYTFGKNDFYQLGLSPPPPQQLFPRTLPFTLNLPEGVNAASYHSVAWGTTDLYTWGYNCGQLGYTTEEKYQITPRRVECWNEQCFIDVASTDSAIVVLTMRYEIYLLNRNACFKIRGLLGFIRQIHISGGHLDASVIKSAGVNSWNRNRTEDDLMVLIVNRKNRVMIWKYSTFELTRCSLLIGNRPIKVTDVAVGNDKLIVVTNEYEVFEADYKINKPLKNGSLLVDENTPQMLVANNPTVVLEMKRVRLAHRAISVSCDPKGSSYCMIQINPIFFIDIPRLKKLVGFEKYLLSLLEEAKESDLICDVVFNVAGIWIPAHRFIVESKCMKLASLLSYAEEAQSSSSLQLKDKVINESDSKKNRNILNVKLENIHPLIFREILKYIYTGTFDYCSPSTWSLEKDKEYFHILQNNEALMNIYCQNYKYELIDEYSSGDGSSLTESASKKENLSLKISSLEYDPVDDACRTAAYFELNDLVKKLRAMKYIRSERLVCWKSNQTILGEKEQEIYFNRLECLHLYDIVIECIEGRVICAHKCIIIMRSKYFETLLKGDWLESSERKYVFLPFTYKIVKAILFYFYRDQVPFCNDSSQMAFICQILAAADQILAEELKYLCENTLGTLLTLKNVSTLFKFSDTYKAHRLQDICIEFMSANMAALLDSREMDVLDDDLINDLQQCYWGMRPILSERTIATPRKYPDLKQLQSILEDVGVPTEENHFNRNGNSLKPLLEKEAVIESKKKSNTKKKQKMRNSIMEESNKETAQLFTDTTAACNSRTKSKKLGQPSSLIVEDGESDEEFFLQSLFSEDNVEKGTYLVNSNVETKETDSTPVTLEMISTKSKGKGKKSSKIDKGFPSSDFNPKRRRPLAQDKTEATQENYPPLEQSLETMETDGPHLEEETKNENRNLRKAIKEATDENTSKKKNTGRGKK